MTIHQRIRTARVMRQISIWDMADMVGRTISTWSKIETGTQTPSIEDIRKVKQAFDMSYEYLIEGNATTLSDWKCEAMMSRLVGKRVTGSKV